MSTTQSLCEETWQPEPLNILVESMPVEERRKLSLNKEELGSIRNYSCEDLLGLSFVLEEEWS